MDHGMFRLDTKHRSGPQRIGSAAQGHLMTEPHRHLPHIPASDRSPTGPWGQRDRTDWFSLIASLSLLVSLAAPVAAFGSDIGIRPLQELHGAPVHSLLSGSVRPLVTVQEMEDFLTELESTIPPWTSLASQDILEQSERLFAFNRHRDHIRELRHPARLHQTIAFLWSADLRGYHEEQQGYHLALGPDIVSTRWGLVRFKPWDIPGSMMVTHVPARLAKQLRDPDQSGSAGIRVLFIGTLVESESIIYAFSHDGDHQGMIMPVVHITDVAYFIP